MPDSGQITFTEAYLEMALANVGSKLHYYASPETTARIEQVAQQAQQAQQQLAVEKEAKARKDAALERQARLEQMQRNRQPGVASAYEGAEEAAVQEAQARKAAEQSALRQQQHAAFLSELRDIEIHQEITGGRINFARTEDARRRMKAALARKYPIFLSEIN